MLSLDGFDGASDAICDLLDGCYASGAPATCKGHIDGAITTSDAAVVTKWLQTIGKGCLDNCSAARLCLDIQPVCVLDVGGPCAVKEDCRGFSDGSRDCSEAHQCCVTAGQRCTSDADCCPEAGACNPITMTCGGTQCRGKGEACDIGDQCCSKNCQHNQCARTICEEDGFPCTDATACCSGYCENGKCGRPQECGLPLSPCTTDADCCPPDPAKPDARYCYFPEEATTGLCSTGPSCLPLEGDCGKDADCCTNHCDPTYFKCGEACGHVGEECKIDAQCCSGSCNAGTCQETVCSTVYCDVDADCCTNHCILHTCAPACGQTTCTHTVCQIGEPLSPTCNGKDACVAAICDSDPYCCCNSWDSFCVVEVAHHPDVCTIACP
ncbi:MAG: hypothetical protein QM820_41265 [Minicystis sp.]